MVGRIGCNIREKILKLSDLGPLPASVPARFPLISPLEPGERRCNPHSISLPTLSLSRPRDGVGTVYLGKPHMCRQHLPSGSPKGQNEILQPGPKNKIIQSIQMFASRRKSATKCFVVVVGGNRLSTVAVDLAMFFERTLKGKQMLKFRWLTRQQPPSGERCRSWWSQRRSAPAISPTTRGVGPSVHGRAIDLCDRRSCSESLTTT